MRKKPPIIMPRPKRGPIPAPSAGGSGGQPAASGAVAVKFIRKGERDDG